MTRTISIILDDNEYRYLRVLALEKAAGADCVEGVIGHLVASAVDGMRRPGSWERGWLVQCFGDNWTRRMRQDPATPWYQLPPVGL